VKTILVATDFSVTAGLALDRACELAAEHGAEVVLVHVLGPNPIPMAGPEVMVLPPNLDEQLREASREALDRAIAEAKDRGVSVSGELETGPAALGVCSLAKRLDADLVVVGTRGNTGFKHLLLGSVAEAVVRESSVPVLTVHPGDDKPVGEVRKLLVPTDFSDDASHALDAVGALFEGAAAQIEITLVHVYQLPVMVAPLTGFGPELPVLAEGARDAAHDALDPLADRLRARGYQVTVVGREGDPATVVTELARSVGADLIAMGTRGLSKLKQLLLGSTAERVVQHAPCPVLTLRRTGD
jgi:nucleotide-binding universal stress UspA family protein